MAAKDALGSYVNESIARKVSVPRKCGAARIKDIQSVAVFKIATVSMSEHCYLSAHFLGFIEYLIGRISDTPVMTVSKEDAYPLRLKEVYIGAFRRIIAVSLDAQYLFFGIGFPHTVEIMLTVTEEYEHRCILVASEYFSDSV